jgi:hypothetical protein
LVFFIWFLFGQLLLAPSGTFTADVAFQVLFSFSLFFSVFANQDVIFSESGGVLYRLVFPDLFGSGFGEGGWFWILVVFFLGLPMGLQETHTRTHSHTTRTHWHTTQQIITHTYTHTHGTNSHKTKNLQSRAEKSRATSVSGIVYSMKGQAAAAAAARAVAVAEEEDLLDFFDFFGGLPLYSRPPRLHERADSSIAQPHP